MTSHILPITETIAPNDSTGVCTAIREAGGRGEAVYPVGGGTSMEFGLTARKPGIGLSLTGLNRVVDYPTRDMTITVEAGMTLATLAETLAGERQWLPIDAPQPNAATIGGLVATGFNGPRRYGWGTIRDYVIGISAVDGRGTSFKGGGRVVKNVAGYDFCKLLTGSYGTLGVITQVTLKIKPLAERTALVACGVPDFETAERLLSKLITSEVTPAAVELLAGPAWSDLNLPGVAKLVVGLDGSTPEVEWLSDRLVSEWRELGISNSAVFESEKDGQTARLWERLRDFPAIEAQASPLVIKAALRSSAVCAFVAQALKIDPEASIQAHAGNGIVIVTFARFDAAEISRTLIGKLQPAASAAGGHVIVLSSQGLGELTRQAMWGGAGADTLWMTRVKQQFDPHDLLNPGRFGYGTA